MDDDDRGRDEYGEVPRAQLRIEKRFGKLTSGALVQTFGINEERSGSLRGSGGENCIPDCWRPIVFDS